MTTPYWSDFATNSTFYRILSGFHRTFATGVACRQGTLTPPDTWSRPFGTCICSTCWDQSFSELVVILPDYALRISLGTFSILLDRMGRRKINLNEKIKTSRRGNVIDYAIVQRRAVGMRGGVDIFIYCDLTSPSSTFSSIVTEHSRSGPSIFYLLTGTQVRGGIEFLSVPSQPDTGPDAQAYVHIIHRLRSDSQCEINCTIDMSGCNIGKEQREVKRDVQMIARSQVHNWQRK